MNLTLAMAPADAHALTMVAILAFALGSLVTMFLVMARNGRKNEELDLPDLAEEEEKPHPEKSGPAPASWEKDADWWK